MRKRKTKKRNTQLRCASRASRDWNHFYINVLEVHTNAKVVYKKLSNTAMCSNILISISCEFFNCVLLLLIANIIVRFSSSQWGKLF